MRRLYAVPCAGSHMSMTCPEPQCANARRYPSTKVACLLVGEPVMVIGCARRLGDRVRQQQGVDALRRLRCDESHRPTGAEHPHQGGRAHAGRIHDGQDVVGLLLDRGDVGDAGRTGRTRDAGRSRRPREFAPRSKVVVQVRIHPAEVEMEDDLEEVDDVGRPVGDHLVGQRGTVAIDVVRRAPGPCANSRVGRTVAGSGQRISSVTSRAIAATATTSRMTPLTIERSKDEPRGT